MRTIKITAAAMREALRAAPPGQPLIVTAPVDWPELPEDDRVIRIELPPKPKQLRLTKPRFH